MPLTTKNPYLSLFLPQNVFVIHQYFFRHRDFHLMGYGTRWAPTSYKWSYNPYKWPYQWVTGVITPTSGVIALYLQLVGAHLVQFPFQKRFRLAGCQQLFIGIYGPRLPMPTVPEIYEDPLVWGGNKSDPHV